MNEVSVFRSVALPRRGLGAIPLILVVPVIAMVFVPGPDSEPAEPAARIALAPYRQRLFDFQASPALSQLPPNLDGTILRFNLQVYRLFLPEEEKADTLTIPELRAALNTNDGPVFYVEVIRLTEQSKAAFKEEIDQVNAFGQDIGGFFDYHRQVVAITDEDLQEGACAPLKRAILENIIAGATTIPSVTGVPAGYAAYSESQCHGHEFIGQPISVFAMPRTASRPLSAEPTAN
jgi:hypothetical protein